MNITYTYNNVNARHLNRRAVLDLIRFAQGGISRAETARKLYLTRSTVSAIVSDLLDANLIREAESGPTTGGRRPILLELNPKSGYLIGVDIGATHLGIILSDMQMHVVDELETPFDITQEPQACLNSTHQHVSTLLDRSGVGIDKVLSIGVGVPGPVQSKSGIVSSPPIMPGWDGFPIRKYLQDLWNCPVTLNNDAELGAIGEWAYGAGRGTQHMAYIKVGSGIGAGLILGGKIYLGATGMAGEIGHLTIQENGPRCSCGNYGCLEALAGGGAIARRAREAVVSGKRTQLSEIKPVESISARDVGEAARFGDLIAQHIVAEAGEHLGVAIAGVINLSNPSMVVIGGGVSQMGDLFLEPVRRVVNARSLKPAAQAVRISAAMLGRRSSSMGAVVQAVDTALNIMTAKIFN